MNTFGPEVAVSVLMWLYSPFSSDYCRLLAIGRSNQNGYCADLTATGFCFNVGRVLTATGVFSVGSLVAVFGGLGNALLWFSLTFALAFIATWFSRRAMSTY